MKNGCNYQNCDEKSSLIMTLHYELSHHLSTLSRLMKVQDHDTTEYFTERIVLMVLPRREFSNFCIRFLLCHIL